MRIIEQHVLLYKLYAL